MKFKTVKEFLTWISNCQNDIDSKYLYYTFSEFGICVKGADSFEEYKAEGDAFLHVDSIGVSFLMTFKQVNYTFPSRTFGRLRSKLKKSSTTMFLINWKIHSEGLPR